MFVKSTEPFNGKVYDACKKANQIMESEDFYSLIEMQSSFTHTNNPPIMVSNRIRNLNHVEFTVKIYKSKNPWSKAIAYFSATNPSDINLNSRRLNRSVGSIVETLIHEYCHAVGFTHGDNYPKGKQNSVPYKVGELARSLCSVEAEMIIYTKPWYSRLLSTIKNWFR